MFDKLRNIIFRRKEVPNNESRLFYDLTDEQGLTYVNMSDVIEYIPIRNGEFQLEDPYKFKFAGNKSFNDFSIAARKAIKVFQRNFMEAMNNEQKN